VIKVPRRVASFVSRKCSGIWNLYFAGAQSIEGLGIGPYSDLRDAPLAYSKSEEPGNSDKSKN